MNRYNPTPEELQTNDKYELTAKIDHQEIKSFVMNQIEVPGKLMKGYAIYQAVMIIIGLFFATRPIVLAIRGDFKPLLWLLAAIVFTFSLLILIHEVIHLLALLVTGARKIMIGAYLKKFIFYAEADRHVLNRRQYTFVALMPLIIVKLVTLAGIILTAGESAFYFWIFIMCAHTLFCAGDVGMINYFNRFPGENVYTFDARDEKRSYFYREI